MRWIGILLTIAAVGGALAFVGQDLARFANPESKGKSAGAAPEAEPEVPIDGNRRVYASGIVEGTQRDVALRFELTGRVDIVHVREGDVVAKGDVLAQLDALSAEQRVAEAEAKLRLAKAEKERLVNGERKEAREVLKADVKTFEVQVRETEALHARSKQLAQRNAVSAQELDDQKFKYEKAVAQLNAARARLAEIDAPAREDDLSIADARIQLAEATLRHERSMLEKTRMRAPADGVVLHILVEAGELVGPEDERSLITMTNRDRTRVRAYIEELDALAVSVGQSAYVTIDGKPDKKYPGTVLSCSPFVRGKSNRHHRPGELIDVKVREVVVELKDATDLVVGLPVDVFIEPQPSAPVDNPPSSRNGTAPQVSAVESRVEGGP